MMKTISIKPTAEGYARTLITIIERTESPADRQFAINEIVKVFHAAAKAGVLNADTEDLAPAIAGCECAKYESHKGRCKGNDCHCH